MLYLCYIKQTEQHQRDVHCSEVCQLRDIKNLKRTKKKDQSLRQ
jgi:hypothetical protein